MENPLSNKAEALTRSVDVDICLIGALNQLFMRFLH